MAPGLSAYCHWRMLRLPVSSFSGREMPLSQASWLVLVFTYEMTQFVPLAIIVLLTTVFYIWGHAEKHNVDVVVDYSQQTNTEIVLGGGGE